MKLWQVPLSKRKQCQDEMIKHQSGRQQVETDHLPTHWLIDVCSVDQSPKNVSLEIYQVWTWELCLPDRLCRRSPHCSLKKSLHSPESQFFERQVIIPLSTTPTINIKLFTQPLREIPPAKNYLLGWGRVTWPYFTPLTFRNFVPPGMLRILLLAKRRKPSWIRICQKFNKL